MTTRSPSKPKLSTLEATAICGNDIASSCLYVSALTMLYAGKYAWLSLALVGLVLYFFRSIYAEVVGALPLNGGAYNVLLNTTSKQLASLAACLTILSYLATAVLSANEAMHYLHHLIKTLPVLPATITLLALFMVLAIIGIGESAKVAVVIFITHLFTLTLLLVVGGVYLFGHGLDIFYENWAMPLPHQASPWHALFLGFSAAMLGISGFESSANFVEEQADGVFPKTLRNMWAVVSFFNPAIAILALALVPLHLVRENQESLLSFLGYTTGGRWLSILIAIDATLVLSGAVLTSYIGVTGLVERITLDRILPNFFLAKTKKGVNYRIIIAFFILCVTVLFATRGELQALAGVYTFSFLAVMALFGIGNLMLKGKRRRLPRPERANALAVLFVVILVLAAWYGNTHLNPDALGVFFLYFIPALVVILVMLHRAKLIKALIYAIGYFFEPLRRMVEMSNASLNRILGRINSQEFVFFTKGDNVAILNRVMQYVEDNETTRKLKIVNVHAGNKSPETLKVDIEVLDRAYPEIDIEFIELEGEFTPELIDDLSSKWKIPKNFMFIGSPGTKFPYQIAELGGVRLIM